MILLKIVMQAQGIEREKRRGVRESSGTDACGMVMSRAAPRFLSQAASGDSSGRWQDRQLELT